MNISEIKSYFKGNASNRTYLISLVADLLFLFICIIISIVLFEPTYKITEHEISHLDSLSHNPVGLYFFKIGFIIGGLCFLPIAFNIIKAMRSYSKIFGTIAGLFYISAGIGLVVVAFFPTRVSHPMHIVGAGLGFGGLLLAFTFTLILLLMYLKRNYNQKVKNYVIIFYAPFVVVYLLTIIFAGIPLLISMSRGIPFGDFIPEGWFVFEWGMFFTGLYSSVGTQLLFSKILPELKNKEF